MLKAIKKGLLNKALRKKMKACKCAKGFFNFNTAKTVGILFAYDHSIIQVVEDLKEFLAKKNIQCKALAYYSGKEVPVALIDNPYIRYFGKHEVNWYGKCLSAEANVFINQVYDILIDFSIATTPVLHYLRMLSLAKMKTGRLSYPGHPYDFVLSAGSANPKLFADELKHYLLTIEMI